MLENALRPLLSTLVLRSPAGRPYDATNTIWYTNFPEELQHCPDGWIARTPLESNARMEPEMNMETQIGEMARRIRTALGSRGEMTPADLEMTVDTSPQLLDFALGWLAREDKVEILSEDTGTKVRLKFN